MRSLILYSPDLTAWSLGDVRLSARSSILSILPSCLPTDTPPPHYRASARENSSGREWNTANGHNGRRRTLKQLWIFNWDEARNYLKGF